MAKPLVCKLRDSRMRTAIAFFVSYAHADHRPADTLMQRLTELDLDALPAVGAVARGTRAIVERLSDRSFRVFVPQELARYFSDVLDHARERVNA